MNDPTPESSPKNSGSGPDLPPSSTLRVLGSMLAKHLPTLVLTASQQVWISSAVTVAFALFLAPDLRAFVRSNALGVAARHQCLVAMAATTGISLVASLSYLLVRRSATSVVTLSRVTRHLLPLAWIWPLPLFLDWRVFEGHGLLRAVIATVWGLGLERSLRPVCATLAAARPLARTTTGRRWWDLAPTVGVVGLVIWFIFFCGTYTVMEHRRFGTSGFDLGIFDNLLFNLSHGEWFHATVDAGNENGGNHLQYHANFFAFLLVPIYRMAPGPEILLWIQAVLVGLSIIPFYLLAQRRLQSRWLAAGVSVVLLFHEGLVSPVFYQFHFLTIGIFFIGWTLYFFETGSVKLLLCAWILTLLVREDQGTILAGAALVCLMRREKPVWALIGGVVGVAWLALMRFVVMPANGPPGGFHQHSGIFKAMIAPGSNGFGGVLKTLLTNPPYSLQNLLEGRKLEYVLTLAAPFVLLPLRRRLLYVLFVPACLFTLVTTNYAPSVSTRFQYSMYWLPMLMFGSLVVLSDWSRQPTLRSRVPSAVLSMLVVGLSLSYDAGGLMQQNTLMGGFRRISTDMTEEEQSRYKELHELIRAIPPQASVAATESLVPHVSSRRTVRTFRQLILDSEYLLVRKDEVRGGEQAPPFLAAVRSQRWGVIETTQHFQLWKMGAPTQKNKQALRTLGHRGR